jgi:hypothetical protein
MRVKLENVLSLWRATTALICLLLAAVCCAAQSSDLNYPTPVVTNEIEGRIAPRDLGDPRLTSYFYTFNGTQGDIIINIESLNLDGAVDLFLAPALRPLTQFTLIATGSALNVSKSVFLRKEETIVLRVQARTPNDTDGTYRIRLGGAFQPAPNIAAEPPQPEAAAANKPDERPTAKGVHRVNAVGARIEEPEPVAPAAATGEETRAEESPQRAPARTARTPTPRTGTTRRTRTPTRTGTARSSKPAPGRKTETSPTEPTQTVGGEPAPTESPEPAPAKTEPTRTPRTRTGRTTRNTRGGETARRTREPAKQPAEGTPTETGGANEPPAPTIVATRLVIELRDGAPVEHEMGTVSRVTVVSGLIVVILKNGHVERYPLTNVLRMAIEP